MNISLIGYKYILNSDINSIFLFPLGCLYPSNTKVIIGGIMEIKNLIGKRIKEIRRSNHLSQEQLAEKADINSKYLSRMERGTENPTLDMLIKLSNALEVEMWEMFDFGHVKSHRELKDSLQSILKTSDEPSLRLALKVLRAVSR
jgi:transcriptional regulator with XRE-family HTH domain